MCILWRVLCLRVTDKNEGNLDSVISNGNRPTREERPEQRPSPSFNPHTSTGAHPGSPSTNLPSGFAQSTTCTQNNAQPQAANATYYFESPENTQTKQDAEGSSDISPQSKYPKIDDFSTIEELESLSSKDLKILLSLNRIDYKGCVEKEELLERARRLWEDNEQKKESTENIPVQDLCKLCMDAPLDCVLLQCGHMATCIECGKKLAECPICRQYIARVVRTFKA